MLNLGICSTYIYTSMHIGNVIKKELERQGKTVVWLAGQLSYSRANIYKIFDKPSIDTDVLYRISIALQLDLFKIYSDAIEEHKRDCIH